MRVWLRMENPWKKQAGSAVGADGAIAAGGGLALGKGHGGVCSSAVWIAATCPSKAAARSALAWAKA
jgi:hypothetical protein